MIDSRTGAILCRLFPLDKAQNSDGRRRALKTVPQDGVTSNDEPPESGIAPLLSSLMADYAATGLPPAYLPKGERESDHDTDDNTPLSNLFVSLAQRMGVQTENFGSSTAAGIRGLEG